MKKKDYSKEILDNYVSTQKLLRISLKSGETLRGRLVSFFHGEPDEPYIIKWHFVSERDMADYDGMPFTGDEAHVGKIINQEDIMDVSFA